MTETDTVAPTGPQPGQTSSANTTATEVMKNATLPSPGTSTGGPITTVYGKKSPAVWASRGWVADAAGVPNITSVKVVAEVQKMVNADLANAEADIVKNDKAIATWEPEGWLPGAGTGTPATGATAGTPGTFTPAGADPPADVAAMTALTASPTTAWASGEYVQTATAGTAGEAYWDGAAWQPGKAVLVSLAAVTPDSVESAP